MPTVELVTWRDALARISTIIRDSVPSEGKLRVVEAGCGRRWGIDVDPELCEITGIDTDEEALRLRMEEFRDIHEPIVGDVQNSELVPAASADVVYSSFVLEHLPQAEEAAAAWVGWLNEGGMLIFVVPDATSAYGFISRHTPHVFHVGFYRYVLGRRLAGTPGHAPYPVAYSPLLTVDGLERFAERHRLIIREIFAIGAMRPRLSSRDRLMNLVMTSAKFVSSAISGGRLAWRHDNLAVVMTKERPS